MSSTEKYRFFVQSSTLQAEANEPERLANDQEACRYAQDMALDLRGSQFFQFATLLVRGEDGRLVTVLPINNTQH